MPRLPMLLAALVLASPVLASPAEARVLTVGPAQDYALPSAAAQDASDGDTIRIHPATYLDCAILTASSLLVEGVGDPAQVLLTDKSCAGKGILITQGNGITVRNLTLAHARVPDGNGAGIRNEAPDLTVDRVRFIDNQNGILSTPATPGTLLIRNSLFERNGNCANAGGCAHGIYAGVSKLLRIENSTFIGTRHGHHIKSRGERTEIIGCTIQDGPEGTASYVIEQPNGGALVVRNNTLEKGPKAENRVAAIMIGSEPQTQRTPEITIEDNSFRNDGNDTTAFVDNRTATNAVLRRNRLSGPVKPLTGNGNSQ